MLTPPRSRPVDVVACALVDELRSPTRLLAARRTAPPELAGGWEFPGGKVELGESPEDALRRELAEELGVTIVLGDLVRGPLRDGRWCLSRRHRLRLWLAAVDVGEPRPLEDHDALCWVTPLQARSLAWLPGDRPALEAVLARLR